ncbi:MAG: periplasmic heavy metal sensor [Deltaproteobacteria bacterium]|nr:periplasmic heavy metal sensor [Deltaproteobacteria bacterium]
MPPSAPPAPPAPPVRAGAPRKGVRVTMRDGRPVIEGISDIVRAQLAGARAALAGNGHVPRELRDKINARLEKVGSVVDRQLSGVTDFDDLSERMEQMGEEIEALFEGLDEFGKDFGKDLGKDLGKLGKDLAKLKEAKEAMKAAKRAAKEKAKDARDARRDARRAPPPSSDDDGEDEIEDPDTGDDEDAVAPAPAVATPGDWKGMTLKPSQREEIVKLRKESERDIAAAQKELAVASQRLEVALADPKASDADIKAAVDRVSGHEAAIRKARLLAWVKARRLLDPDQRAKIEGAALKSALKR